MKRRTTALLITLAFVLLACGVAYAAGLGIFDVQVQDGASLTPQLADKTPVEPVSGEGMTYYPEAERLGLQYSKDIESGREYLVMVIEGEDAAPTETNVVYIDQLTAEGSSIEFNLYPAMLKSDVVYHVCLSTNASGSEGLKEIASFRYGSPEAGVDKSALESAVSLAEALVEEDYTPESWAALQEALAAAKEVLANDDATQEEVDAALAALRQAIEELVQAPSFTLSETEITVPAQSTYKLTAEGADNLSWSSDNETVAAVDQTGKVSAKLYGTAIISVTDGKTTLSCTVHVLFSDVVNASYYFNPVYWAAENGITVGYTSGANIGKFGVGLNCQRRELMIFLWRYVGCPGKGDEVSAYGDARKMFNDLKSYGPSSATNQAIAWAYKEGITKGYSDGGFHPTNSIERKDVMILLYRLAGKPSVSGTLSFSDCQSYKPGTDTYNAILWGSQNEITKGYSDGTFGPRLNCLREQIVTFLYRFNNLESKVTIIDEGGDDEIIVID